MGHQNVPNSPGSMPIEIIFGKKLTTEEKSLISGTERTTEEKSLISGTRHYHGEEV